VRPDRLVDNEGGAGLVDPKTLTLTLTLTLALTLTNPITLTLTLTYNVNPISNQVDPKMMGIDGTGGTRPSRAHSHRTTTSAAASGSFALARLTSAQGGGATGAQAEQPSARTIQREVGKKWNAATRSFV